MSQNLIRDTKLRRDKEKLPELKPADMPRKLQPGAPAASPSPQVPVPAAAPQGGVMGVATDTVPAPTSPLQPSAGMTAGGIAGAVATGQISPPPPAPSLDPFAPVTLGNDAIQPVPVTYEGQTPAQVVQESLLPVVKQELASDKAQQAVASQEIANPLPVYEGLYKPPDWNTVLNSGIYEPTFTNQAQIQADPSLGSLNDALGGLLSAIQKQSPESSVGGAFGWVTNAFSKDGSRNYVRSAYLDKDGNYKGNFLGGALYGLGLLWNAPAGAVIDAKNVGSNIFNKFAPQWVKSSAGATYRWASARAPVIGALLEPWTKRDPYNDGKSNFIEALRGASYSFGDDAGKGFGIKREETLGNIPGTNVPFNPTAVLGVGLDILAGGKVDRLLERALTRTGKAATGAAGVADASARAANAAPPTAGGVYEQIEIPFVSGPVPTNPVPPRVRKPRVSDAARERRRAMAEAAKQQLSLDLGDAVKRTVMPDPWTSPPTGTTPGRVNRVLQADGPLLKPVDILDGVPQRQTTVTPPSVQPRLPGVDQPPLLAGAATTEQLRLPAGQAGGAIQQLGESSLVVNQRASNVVDVDWYTVFELEGAPVRLALPEAAPPVEFIPRIETGGQLTLPLDVPSTPTQLNEVVYQALPPISDELDSVAYQLSFHADDFGNISITPFVNPNASLLELETVARGITPSFGGTSKNILEQLGWETSKNVFLGESSVSVSKTFGGTELSLQHLDINEVSVSFTVGGSHTRSGRLSSEVPYSELKGVHRAIAEVANSYPDLKLTATIAAKSPEEFAMKLKSYRRAGFIPTSETGAVLPDSKVDGDTVLIFDRKSASIANRLDTAVTELRRLDATRLNPVATMRDARLLRDSVEGAKAAGRKALDSIEDRLSNMTVGRFPVASTEVRPTRPFTVKLELGELPERYRQVFHGTRSTADVLSVDSIRGGATSATGRGLHVTIDPHAASYYASKPVNVDLPEATAAFMGNPRLLELEIAGPVREFSIFDSSGLDELVAHVKQSFPELTEIDLRRVDLPRVLSNVREAVSPEVAREFEVHLAEAMKDAGIEVLTSSDKSTLHFLDTSSLALVSSTPKSVLMSTSELAQADVLARSGARARTEFDSVDKLHSLHRYVNQELQAISQTESYLDSIIDNSVDKAKLWDYNAVPENVPPVALPEPTPPPASRVPWESTDDIGPCLL